MKENLQRLFGHFSSIKQKVTSWYAFFPKTKRNLKQNLFRFLKVTQFKNLKSLYQKLLSEHNRYLIHALVILVAIVLACFNIFGSAEQTVSAHDSSILVDLLFPENNDQIETVIADFDSEKKNKNAHLSMISIASAAFIPGSITTNYGVLTKEDVAETNKGTNLVFLHDNTLIKTSPVQTRIIEKPREEIIKYKVRSGDTIFNIAKRFGIDAATILQENRLYADDIIKPGMELTILPVSGTTERVDAGETLQGIVKKHEADLKEVMKFNKLVNATDIEEGQILIIPGGKREIKERPRPERSRYTMLARGTSFRQSRGVAAARPYKRRYTRRATSNGFPWGYCTWYVASRRGDVTWRGNAGAWLRNAKAQGRATGRIPAVGAIIVTAESWWGHVGIVESIQGDKVTISEMNYAGYGKVNKRTISNKSSVIKGYIY